MIPRSPSRRSLHILACLAFLVPVSALGQESEPDRGRGYFEIGYMALDLDDLNGRLGPEGYPALDGSFLTLGGGGYGERGRLLIGGEGHAVLGASEDVPDGRRRVSLDGGYGLFRIGFIASSPGGVDVVPALGVGGGGLTLGILERSAPTFGEVLDEPGRSSRLSSGSFLLDASIAAHYRIPSRREDDAEGGLMIGLHAGYTFAAGGSSWRLDGLNDVSGGPAVRIEGAYIRLAIGGWGRPNRPSEG
jgi:hypothetical protein